MSDTKMRDRIARASVVRQPMSSREKQERAVDILKRRRDACQLELDRLNKEIAQAISGLVPQ